MMPAFNFLTHCFFCGDKCQLKPDPRHPNRWKRVVKCQTAEQGDRHNFKQSILNVCEERKDVQAEEVRIRLEGAVSDLHAADALYHKTCHDQFMSKRSRSAASKSTSTTESSDQAFLLVAKELETNKSRIWNSVEVFQLYQTCSGIHLNRRSLIMKLVDYFGQDLLVLSGNGVANILDFRNKASNVL